MSLGKEKELLLQLLGDATIDRGNCKDDGSGGYDNDRDSHHHDSPISPNGYHRNNTNYNNNSGSSSAGKSRSDERIFEGLLYRDHLYKKLCSGLIDIYEDLIHRLYTNTFIATTMNSTASTTAATTTTSVNANNINTKSNNQTTSSTGSRQVKRNSGNLTNATDISSSIATSNPSSSIDPSDSTSILPYVQTKTPYTLGQAIEEYKFLKVA